MTYEEKWLALIKTIRKYMAEMEGKVLTAKKSPYNISKPIGEVLGELSYSMSLIGQYQALKYVLLVMGEKE